MQHPLAQIVALTCYANAALRGRLIPFFPHHSTCVFCETVAFVRIDGKREDPVAPSPDLWFRMLQEDSCQHIHLHNIPQSNPQISDRMSSGFVGGGRRWLMEATYRERADYWEARWSVGNQKAPDKRIWRVTYGLIAVRPDETLISVSPLATIRHDLLRTLADIHEFALHHDLGSFADYFSRATECLESDTPFALVYHKDLAPDGLLPLEATQLLAAANAAWVFGGMGSWNDLGFDGADQTRYESLSDALFTQLNTAIYAATNTSATNGA